MSKLITSEKETREKILSGVLKLVEVVGSTLGPMANNVVIETPYGATTVTKDGVTVAKHVNLPDPVENLGVEILKQAAARTASLAGDGTTTATVIAGALVQEANKLISAGIKPILIKRRFESLLLESLQILLKESKAVTPEKIQEIATIAANNDEEIGALIAEAYAHVGSEGLVSLDESKSGKTELELVQGAAFDKGYASPYFITNASKEECVLDNPLIFITDGKLRYGPEIVPIMEKAIQARRPLLIIADEIEGQALQILAVNKMRAGMQVCAVAAPSFGQNRVELLRDIAALTSARLVSEDEADRIEDTTLDDMGTSLKVVISKNRTLFIESERDEDRINKRADEIRTQLTGQNDLYMQQKLQRRLADLKAKVAILYVGAPTDTELKERKDRVDDALRATSCAITKGYLIGGGTALARLGQSLKVTDNLIDPIFTKALQQPLMLLATNAGQSGEVVLSKVLDTPPANIQNFGYNARSGQFSDLEKDGVIDPLLVVEQALTNAVSAANMIILAASSITNLDRTPPYSPDPHGYAS